MKGDLLGSSVAAMVPPETSFHRMIIELHQLLMMEHLMVGRRKGDYAMTVDPEPDDLHQQVVLVVSLQ